MAVEVIKKKNPHLAITHNELQGGSANKRNASLLMKSDIEITEEIATLIEKVAGVKVEVTKASVNTVRRALEDKLKDKFKPANKDYYWIYVDDFDENYVVFSTDDGLFYTTYSVDGLEVSVGDEAVEVSRIVSYVEESEGIILHDKMEDIDSGVYSLIVKSFDSISKNEKLVDVIKSKKGNKMTEIEKAVEVATTALKQELEKAQADLKAAQEQVVAFEKAAKEQKESVRKAKIAEFVKDEQEAEDLFKSTEVLADEAFEVIVKSLATKAEQIEKSDLFEKQTEKEDVEKADEVPMRVKMLQDKYNKQ